MFIFKKYTDIFLFWYHIFVGFIKVDLSIFHEILLISSRQKFKFFVVKKVNVYYTSVRLTLFWYIFQDNIIVLEYKNYFILLFADISQGFWRIHVDTSTARNHATTQHPTTPLEASNTNNNTWILFRVAVGCGGGGVVRGCGDGCDLVDRSDASS